MAVSKAEQLWLYKLIVLDIIQYDAEVTYNWNGKKKTVKCSLKTKKKEELL